MAALCVLGGSGVAGATHSKGSSSGPPHDLSSGSFKGELPNSGASVHARYTAHLPAVQPATGAFDGVRGEAVVDQRDASGQLTKHRGDLLCGMVDGDDAFLLYVLRDPVATASGPSRHMALMAFDNGRPNAEPQDEVAFAFVHYGGPPPEESRECLMIGLLFDRTHGNVVVHDSLG